MNIEHLKTKIPEYAKDIKLNISNLLGGIESVPLDKGQIAALALAAAYATRQKTVIQWLTSFAQEQGMSDATMHAVKAAASIMAMNNVYYRSVHWISGDTYKKLAPNLRMQVLQKHGMATQDFELWCVVVSAINGCERCLDAHVATLNKGGMSAAVVQYALRTAAVVHAFAQVVSIEESC